ncbi:MAG TPA: hypothetical protein VE621_01830 [Bryobacteraceae bacterium]|nr:hypothetical protein [Bryobacteraceae bacterium]
MIENKQMLFGERLKKLAHEEWITGSLVMHKLRERHDACRFAANSVRNELFEVFAGKRRKRDLLYLSAGALDSFELASQRMSGIDLIVPIGADYH